MHTVNLLDIHILPEPALQHPRRLNPMLLLLLLLRLLLPAHRLDIPGLAQHLGLALPPREPLVPHLGRKLLARLGWLGRRASAVDWDYFG